jgi:hypothetical protein
VGAHVVIQFLAVFPNRPAQRALVLVHCLTPVRTARPREPQRSTFGQLILIFRARPIPGEEAHWHSALILAGRRERQRLTARSMDANSSAADRTFWGPFSRKTSFFG